MIVIAQLFLAWVAWNALSLQAREETSRQRREAEDRLQKASNAFHLALSARHASDTGLAFPAGAFEVASLTLTGNTDPNVFLALAASSGAAKRAVILQALLDATGEVKPFWNLLLARADLDAGKTETAREALGRILEGDQDIRLPGGWTVRGEAAFLRLLSSLEAGRLQEAIDDLCLLSMCPAPLRSDLLSRIPGNLRQHLGAWQPLLPAIWSASATVSELPRWTTCSGAPVLALPRREGGILIPGAAEFKALERVLSDAVGPRFPIRIYIDSNRKWLSGCEGVSVKWSGPVAGDDAPFGRVLPGLLITLGLLGVALLVQNFWRRSQEGRYWAEQERFYRQAAHDLKTPLSTLRTLAETLSLGRISEPGQAERYFQTMIREADQAAGVVDGMLLAARLESGLVQPVMEAISPREIVTGLLERVGPRLEGWTVDVDLPPALTVSADHSMFSRALLNLVENALRHAASGRTLLITAARGGARTVDIRVGDAGPGRIEGGTFRLAPSSPTGSGLGLILARTIVERHGGVLRFENRSGGGVWAITSWKEESDDGNDHGRRG